MTIIVEGLSCKDQCIETNNGKIVNTGNCQYDYIPEKIGLAILEISKCTQIEKKVISHERVIINKWPKPEAWIAGMQSGKMSLGFFKAQPGIFVSLSLYELNGSLPPKSFQFSIFRNNELVLVLQNEGGAFNNTIRKSMDSLRKEDTIIIDKIKVEDIGTNDLIELAPLTIEII